MADLKAGTTIGGTLVWTQGNFPLFPTGNTLVYKTFKVYSENDKPQAVDNDFVSKANGGVYLGDVGAKSLGVNGSVGNGAGLSLYNGAVNGEPLYGVHFSQIASAAGGRHPYDTSGPWATYFKHSSDYSWNFKVNNTVVAYVSSKGLIVGSNLVSSQVPTLAEHVTRKDYVDTAINTVTTNANNRVLRAGDAMTGVLSAPNFVSNNDATQPSHVPRFAQIVVKGTILDYGRF